MQYGVGIVKMAKLLNVIWLGHSQFQLQFQMLRKMRSLNFELAGSRGSVLLPRESPGCGW